VEESASTDESAQEQISQSRLQLIWDVLVFQLKLTVDGLRDLVLVPISLFAALAGLLLGGSQPAQYFHRVLQFGRRTEFWINLFGHKRVTGTSDEIIKPIQDRVFEEAHNRPWLRKAGTKLNQSIDTVGGAIKPSAKPDHARKDDNR